MSYHPYKDYQARDELLVSMGYASYKEYLRSPTWRKIREKVLERANGLCELCGEPAAEVHHLSYSKEILRGDKRKLRHLIAICRACHQSGEFAAGQKVSRPETNRRMNRPGLKECPLCKKARAWTDFENFSGTQVYKVCKSCRRKKSNRKHIRRLGSRSMTAKYNGN
jgi:hypothetical protein